MTYHQFTKITDLNHHIQKRIESSGSDARIIYVGADWCSPCKAVKPLLLAQAAKQSCEIEELDASYLEIGEDSDNPWLKSLPLIVRAQYGVVVMRKNGIVNSSELQLLVLGKLAGSELEKHIHELSTLLNTNLAETQYYYSQLSSEMRYEPALQRVKSLVDLMQSVEDILQQNNLAATDHYYSGLMKIRQLNVAMGIEVLITQLQQDINTVASGEKSEELAEYYKLCVHAINTLEQPQIAQELRLRLKQVMAQSGLN